MAGKSAMPLIIAGGAAALLLYGKKKKSAASVTTKNGNGAKLKKIDWLEVTTEEGGDERLVIDQECMNIANKLNASAHNTWITNRYFQLIAEGNEDLELVTLQLLKDQSEHCPWSEPGQWTPLMKSLYEQLLTAVKGWHEVTGGRPLPQG